MAKKSDLSFHAAANIFPLMEEAELDALADDIEKHGLLTPIELFEGKIIDGRNRYLACLRRCRDKIETVEIECDDPVAYVLSLNLHRRHLTETQKAMVAARVREHYAERAKQRMEQGGKTAGRGRPKQGPANLPDPIDTGEARDQAGKAVGVSGKSVDHAGRVLAKGTSALIDACDRGEVSVSAAAVVAELPKAEQNAVIKSGAQNGNLKKAIATAAREIKEERFKPPTTYPAIDLVQKHLAYLVALPVLIEQKYGSVAEMLESPEWHKPSTSMYASMFRDGIKVFTRLAKEFDCG